MPHKIWVRGLVRQSEPTLAILLPGTACGIPYAPEEGLLACGFQPLSRIHSLLRYVYSPAHQPWDLSSDQAICCGERRLAATASAARSDRDPCEEPGPPHPLRRQRIVTPMSTGAPAIDPFIPLGIGQRLGLFAGSGVGKSTLLGMIARGTTADVVV